MTLLGTAGLTAVAFITRKDFSFLRSLLMWGGMLALVAIVGGVLFGFALGTWFSVAMIGFAGAAVLYDTSNILHHYPEDRYVGAALAAVRLDRADVLVRAAAASCRATDHALSSAFHRRGSFGSRVAFGPA